MSVDDAASQRRVSELWGKPRASNAAGPQMVDRARISTFWLTMRDSGVSDGFFEGSRSPAFEKVPLLDQICPSKRSSDVSRQYAGRLARTVNSSVSLWSTRRRRSSTIVLTVTRGRSLPELRRQWM